MGVGKLTRYGLPFSNVIAAGVATNNITPGRTLNNLQLKLGGTAFTKAMITLIKLKANGKVVMEMTGTQADKLNAYKGQPTDVNYLDIQFFERAGLTEFDRAVGGFDTSQVGNITTEITIAGATAPTLVPILTESSAQIDAAGQPSVFAGVMSKVLRYPFNIATGGRLPVTVPFGPGSGSVIKRLHVEHTGNMTGATVKQDGLVVHESLRLENEYEQKRWGRVPQANLYTLDFMVDGNVNKSLDTRSAKSLEWLFDFSAADSGYVVVEYLDTLGNL
jgi:hypothetical protein